MIVVVLLGGEIMWFSYDFQLFVQEKYLKICGQWTDMTYISKHNKVNPCY